jgi:tetratricopeptide (TPR) repeat protein
VRDFRLTDVISASGWLRAEEEAGEVYGTQLLAIPTARWRSEMDAEPNFRRYGTLRFVIDAIHEQLCYYPLDARERAAVVVRYIARVDVPAIEFRVMLGGLAWKEYSKALRFAHEYSAAIQAAKRSRRIFSSIPSLACEAAKARLCEALVYREQGHLDLALEIARSCATVFRDFEDAEAFVQARMTEALALSDAQRPREAMEIFSETAAAAEKRGDKDTLARCIHNVAVCARADGDVAMARRLDQRALELFEELGTTVGRPKIRWNEAMALVAEGRVSTAILELRKARAELLELGMNADAATYQLDIVGLRFERGEDVTSECADLVDTFTRAGMIQSAIEALAYLREQSRQSKISLTKIRYVREYVSKAAIGPPRLFVMPPDDDRGGET